MVYADGGTDDSALYHILAAIRPHCLVRGFGPRPSRHTLLGRAARHVSQSVSHLEPNSLRSEAPPLSVGSGWVPAGLDEGSVLSRTAR